MFSLKISERGGSTEVRTFEKPEVSIGRIQGNDIVLPKGNISKRHARIVNRDNDFVVVDLRSTNGTYVNGQRVTSPMVVSGEDKLYIGDFIIQVARGDASAEADAQPLDETRALDFDDEIAVIEEPASSPGVSSPEQPLALAIAEEADDGELPETVEATAEPLHSPAPVHEPAHAEETAEAPRAAAPAAATPAEAYAHALRLFHDRAKRSVFAGLDLDNIDFDSQWHELERAVYSLAALTTDILYEFTALGPIEYFLADDDVSEIHVGAHNLIFVRRGGTVELDDQKAFSSPEALHQAVERLIRTHGAHRTADQTLLRGRLDDGTAFQIVFPPLVSGSASLSFVKPPLSLPSASEWTHQGRLSADAATWLATLLGDGASLLVYGPALEGTFDALALLVTMLPAGARLAFVEGAPRIALPHSNAVRLDASQAGAADAAARTGARFVIGVDIPDAVAASLIHGAGATHGGLLLGVRSRSAEDLGGRLELMLGQGGAAAAAATFDAAVQVGTDAQGRPQIQKIQEIRNEGARLTLTEIH
jgi:pilus assembly protein CpaF